MWFLFESTYLNIFTLSSVLITCLYLYLTATFNYWKDRGVPFLPPLPFFGNIIDLVLARRAFPEVFQTFYKQLEGQDFGGFFQSRTPALIIRNLDLVKLVLVKDFIHFQDRAIIDNEVEDPLTAHLFNLQGQRWRNLRVKLTPTFTSGKMKMMYHLLQECGEEFKKYLTARIADNADIELKEVLAKFTTDVIGTCAFGLQCNSMKDSDSEFRKMGRKIFESSLGGNLRRTCLIFLPGVAKFFKLKFVPSDLTKFFIGVVKETIEYRESNKVVRNDFMDLLIQLKHKGIIANDEHDQDGGDSIDKDSSINLTADLPASEPMTDNLIAAQAFVFFVAGFETSSTTMTFCLYELAVNPDIQETLRSEIKACLVNCGGKINYASLNQMEYLHKVVSETLRKYPPVGNLVRKCTKSYTIPNSNVVIEKGTRVFVPVYGIHHDPLYYPEPDKFLPERFDEEEIRKRHHYAYLPFGEGPRVCIGQRFGMMQTKLGLAVILANYRVSVCEKTAIPLVLDPRTIIISSVGGMWLKLQAII